MNSENFQEHQDYIKNYGSICEEFGATSSNNQTIGRNFNYASAGETFLNHDTNQHVRSEYSKEDYYRFRRSERMYKNPKAIIRACDNANKNVGIVNNTINLMCDFASKGIQIVHKNKKVQKFLREWFKFVNGNHVTDRILSNFYGRGNSIIERFDGKITQKAIRKWQATAFLDAQPRRNEIPRGYIIHNIQNIEKFGTAVVTEKPDFYLRITEDVISDIAYFKKQKIQVKYNAKSGELVKLDGDKIYDYYYKKDDWEKWGMPMTFPILNELIMLDKVELADMSALDGAISNVRLWTLGDFEHRVYPSREGINKLRNILARNVGGGVIDLVWGPELKFIESNTQIHHFLGKEKYEAILTLIYAGLGIPSTMTGTSTTSGTTSNSISMKTLVERLQYGRNIVIDFWEKQLNIVMSAMNFLGKARVTFTYNVLSDEAAEKKLLMDLMDRDIVSSETVRDIWGFDPEIEQFKVNREVRRRGKTDPYKASPYHNPQIDHELRKLFVQSGAFAPSEFGIELDPKTGEPPEEIKSKFSNKTEKMPQSPGRPKNSRDVMPRNRKAKSTIEDIMKYGERYSKVSPELNTVYLNSLGKSNMRELTKKEYLDLERMKFDILCLSKADNLTEESIISVFNIENKTEARNIATQFIDDFQKEYKKLPTIEQVKQIYLISLALGEQDV